MILFKNIRWKNLLSTGNTFTEVDFIKHNMTLMVGENGAGKSTILDALTFALYGKPFRKVNKSQLINTINNKDVLIELEFQIGKKEYLIRRGIKPNIFEIWVDGFMMDQHAEAKETQEVLETQILKLNHRSFNQIVILGSASFVPFMQLSATHRREVIEDILDIQIFSTMNTLLKEKISLNKMTLTEVDFEMKSIGDRITLQKKHMAALQESNDEAIKKKEDKVADLTKQIEQSTTDMQKLNKEVSDLNDAIKDSESVSERIERIRELEYQISNKLKRLQKDISFFESSDDCPTCRQGIEHDHKSAIIDRNNNQIQEIESGQPKMQEEIDKLQQRINAIADINQKISELNRSIADHNVQINTWNTFIKDINEEISELRSDTKNIDDNTDELAELKDDLKDALAQREELAKDKQVLDVASMLLRDSGIKTKIIKQYIPIMNKLINKYLASMDFFVNFELDENFKETIRSRFRDAFSYDSFSEGEKMRIDLALLFTWRAVAKLRNSASTNLLIMDEVFDSSLDDNGTDEFLKILHTLTSDTNTFIISHKGDQLFEKFDHVIRFEKHKNFSRIAQ